MSWDRILGEEFEQDYYKNLLQFLKEEKSKHIIYPPTPLILSAFEETPWNNLKVVLISQDPYHGPNQAHGLCFSVQKGVKIPPSLRNIYKELHTDIPGFQIPEHGYLIEWAKQGVLMINATLTVRDGEPGSHQKKGWETFTDNIIRKISFCFF